MLYIGVALLTLTFSGLIQLIRFGNPYRFRYAAFTGDVATIDAMLVYVDGPETEGRRRRHLIRRASRPVRYFDR